MCGLTPHLLRKSLVALAVNSGPPSLANSSGTPKVAKKKSVSRQLGHVLLTRHCQWAWKRFLTNLIIGPLSQDSGDRQTRKNHQRSAQRGWRVGLLVQMVKGPGKVHFDCIPHTLTVFLGYLQSSRARRRLTVLAVAWMIHPGGLSSSSQGPCGATMKGQPLDLCKSPRHH